MLLRPGRSVRVWYRYPSDLHPRELRARVSAVAPHASIADAVATCIATDLGWDLPCDAHPALALSERIVRENRVDAWYALRYAALPPPPYRVPPSSSPPVRKRAAAWEEGVAKRARVASPTAAAASTQRGCGSC